MSQEALTTKRDSCHQQLIDAICTNNLQQVFAVVRELHKLSAIDRVHVLSLELTTAGGLYECVLDPLHPVSEKVSVTIKHSTRQQEETCQITAETTGKIGLYILNELLNFAPITVKKILESSIGGVIETFRYDRLPMEIGIMENPLMVVMKSILSSEKPNRIQVNVYLAQLFLAEKFSALGFARGIADELLRSSSNSLPLFQYLQGLQVIPATQPYAKVKSVMSNLIAVVNKGKKQDEPPLSYAAYQAQILEKSNLPVPVAGIIISYLFTPKRTADGKPYAPDLKGLTGHHPAHTDDTDITNTGLQKR